MDDWLSAFSDEGIEVVDSPKGKSAKGLKDELKDPGTRPPTEPSDEVEIVDVVEAKKEEDETGGGRRRLGGARRSGAHVPAQDERGLVALLTREGEVEISKRMEEGQRRVLQVVLNSSIAIEEILNVGDDLRKERIRVKEVVKDIDEEDVEFDEQWHVERVCKAIDKVRRLWKDQEKVAEKLDAKTSDADQEECTRAQINELKLEMVNALIELRLKKTQDRQDRLQAQGVRRPARARQSGDHLLRAQVGSFDRRAPANAARDPLLSPAAAGGGQEAGPPVGRDRGAFAGHRRRAEEDQEGRGRGAPDRAEPA